MIRDFDQKVEFKH